jgi:hypothetical protein
MTPPECLAVCHHCPRKVPGPNALTCGVSRNLCRTHAAAGECPLGFYVPGSLSIGKANVYRPIAGPDAASPRLILAREMVCRACEHVTIENGALRACSACGCGLGAKVRDNRAACPVDKWGPPARPERWYSHTGAIGDMIYALHAIRAAGGGALYTHHDASIRPEHYMSPWHAAMLGPLVLTQPYMTHYELVDDWPTATHRLDTFRDLDLHKNDLVALHHLALGLPVPEEITPWLTTPNPYTIAPVIFHRSFRYRNREGDALWRRIVAAYPGAVFVGLPREHGDFCDRFGDIPYHHTKDLLDLANAIAGAQLFCGNQSSPFAVATGLGGPTVLEVDPTIPDCCFNRPNATHAWVADTALPVLGAPAPTKPPVYHVHHAMPLIEHPDAARVENARCTWGWAASIDKAWHLMPLLPARTSAEVGDPRAVAYVRDLLDAAAERAGEEGIVVWTNLDVCLVPEAPTIIRRKLARAPCCFSRRVDVEDATKNRTLADLHYAKVHGGTDLFAFRASWWRKRRGAVPDMFIACEAFDFVLRHVMLWDNTYAEITPPILYHQTHEAFWAQPANLQTNPAQAHNRRLAVAWCETYGYEAWLAPPAAGYLLKNDPE